MSDWAGIKKAVNSNLSLPLNEKIDRDIEENRIGHGFFTSSEPTSQGNGLSNNYKQTYTLSHNDMGSYSCSHVLYMNGFYYILGYTYLTSWFKVSEDFSQVISMKPEVPYPFYNASAVVYRGEIYIIGSFALDHSKKFYKFNGTSWVDMGKLSFNHSTFFQPVVHEDKIYLWDSNNKTMRCYDGTNWSIVPLAYTPSHRSNTGQLFYYEDKLHLAVIGNDGSKAMTDFFYLENGTFVSSSYIPNYYNGGSDSDGNFHPITYILPTASGRLYAYDGLNDRTLELLDGSWSYCGTNVYPIITNRFSLVNGKVIQPSSSSSTPTLIVTDLDFYKNYIFYLPENVRIYFYKGEANRFAAISNCRVLEDGLILTLDDGKVEFRSFGDLNTNTPVLFR